MNNKRGQVTIFIIIALVLIAGISFYALIKGKASETKQSYRSSENPLKYISECIESSVRDKIPLILSQGGYIEPQLYANFSGMRVAYLCYNNLNYYPCINQVPLYIQHLEKELKSGIEQDAEGCFLTLKEDYEAKKMQVSLGSTEKLDVELEDRKIIVRTEKEMIITDREETKSYKDFKSSINSPVYNLARVAIEIVSQEATFCHSEYLGYQILYPWVKITKSEARSIHEIYEITDRSTGERLNIAIKGCTIPAGLL